MLFQVSWLVLVLGHEGKFYLLSIPLILFYLAVEIYGANKPTISLAYYLPKIFLFAIGCITDWYFAKLQLIQFASDETNLPFWLLLLWLLFSITFNNCYGWLKNRQLLAAILGSLFGPASYWAASSMSSVEILSPFIFTLFSSIFWGLLFVVFLKNKPDKII